MQTQTKRLSSRNKLVEVRPSLSPPRNIEAGTTTKDVIQADLHNRFLCAEADFAGWWFAFEAL